MLSHPSHARRTIARIINVHAALALFLCWCVTGCAKRAAVLRDVRVGHTESGIASWYGDPYHGRAAANGEIFDMRELTAAHRRLPFGTITRVENTRNGQRVDVRINDRGPFVDRRIIDLSRAAAEQAGLLRDGTARVKLKVIAQPPRTTLAVQAGVFTTLDNAWRQRDQLRSRFPQVRVFYIPDSRRYRLILPAANAADAERVRQGLLQAGIATPVVVPFPAH